MKILSALIKLAIVAVGVSGIIVTTIGSGFMAGRTAWLYFTIQSNIFMILLALIFAIDAIMVLIGKKGFANGWLRLVKFTATVSVTITFLVFVFLLAPQLSVSYLLSYSNFSLHAIVPVLSLLDFFLFDKDAPLNIKTCFLGLLSPLFYFVFFLIGSVAGLRYLGNGFAPYFFLDYQQNGWFSVSEKGLGTFYWVIILFAFFIGLCLLLLLFMKIRRGDFKGKKKQA